MKYQKGIKNKSYILLLDENRELVKYAWLLFLISPLLISKKNKQKILRNFIVLFGALHDFYFSPKSDFNEIRFQPYYLGFKNDSLNAYFW